MYLGYQNGKIKFYTEQPLDVEKYNLDKVEETEDEYALSADCTEYVLKDEQWEEEQTEKRREAFYLYTQFKDDINSVSVQFPYESINEFQLGKYVTQHIESIMIPQALMDEYEVFSVKLSEYHKSDQLDQISNNNSK